MAKVAANCIRTLLLSINKTQADQSIVRYLLPRIINFATTTSNEDPEKARGLVAQTLTAFVATVAKPQRSAAMSIVAPTLLERANKEGEVVYRETSARLIELAGMDQVVFRGIVGNMSEEQKGFMESVIVAGRSAQAKANERGIESADEGEPTIALRMNFGV